MPTTCRTRLVRSCATIGSTRAIINLRSWYGRTPAPGRMPASCARPRAQPARRCRSLRTRTPHTPPGASLLALTSPEQELAAFKLAEDGDGYIVRVVDRHGHGGEGELHWLDQDFAITLAPFEVATLRLAQRHGQWQASACDMIERPLDKTSD